MVQALWVSDRLPPRRSVRMDRRLQRQFPSGIALAQLERCSIRLVKREPLGLLVVAQVVEERDVLLERHFMPGDEVRSRRRLVGRRGVQRVAHRIVVAEPDDETPWRHEHVPIWNGAGKAESDGDALASVSEHGKAEFTRERVAEGQEIGASGQVPEGKRALAQPPGLEQMSTSLA